MAAAAVVLVAAGTLTAVLVGRSAPAVAREVQRVSVRAEPDGTAVTLDATLFRPAGPGPFPAVLLAHGFGGSKDDETADAEDLARHGYLALAWSARGFGASGGRIHLDATAYEVADASRLLDLLAARPDVRLDGPGDPRVGVVGGSYGGALALQLAGTDQRVDAIVPLITWNDLGAALFPQSATTGGVPATPAAATPVAEPGVFKRAWAGVFFSSAAAPAGSGAPGCGRFDPGVCAAYQASAEAGTPTPELSALTAASSPAAVLDRVRAPTLLVQGEADSLFPLGQGDANAAAIARTGTPVRVVWYAGGHDGGASETGRLRELTRAWLDGWLTHGRAPGGPAFSASAVTPSQDGSPDTVRVRTADALPGVTNRSAPGRTPIQVQGPVQGVAAPPGGSPAAVTALPGLGRLAQLAGTAATPPGQSAVFSSAPLTRLTTVVGAPTVDLTVTSSAADAVLFAGLYDDPGSGGTPTLPEQLVAPLRVTVPAGSTTVHVALPAIVHEFAAGHRLRVVVRTTDQAYALPADARTYTVGLAPGAALSLPDVPTRASGGSSYVPAGLGALALALLLAAGLLLAGRRRPRSGRPDPALTGVPLVVRGLEKTYANGYRAVDGLDLRVEQGQVLGLLGPNGAGKTTALRMVLGLLTPTAGTVHLFGLPVRAGAAVLSRVGAFVEGPGLLPHLSGRQNIALAWQATGRPADQAYADEALEVAGLGADLDRRVGTYSQGMRQRLAIAQAMLGLPELLVLDEPTNGLDPPQIREMREVLERYAATGRTVVVSSHLLSEVEQTCTHVVVMARGRAVAQGPVAELVGTATALLLDVDDPERALAVAAELPGVHDLRRTDTGLALRLVGTSRADLVRALVAGGVGVDRLAPQRGLEEAFLALVGED